MKNALWSPGHVYFNQVVGAPRKAGILEKWLEAGLKLSFNTGIWEIKIKKYHIVELSINRLSSDWLNYWYHDGNDEIMKNIYKQFLFYFILLFIFFFVYFHGILHACCQFFFSISEITLPYTYDSNILSFARQTKINQKSILPEEKNIFIWVSETKLP